jgi:MoxR-vWA-beta-propeller ternary system domain bpX4
MENTGLTLSEAGPTLASFLQALAHDGRIVVSPQPIAAPDETALSVVLELNHRAQSELAGEGPGFSSEAALWAANLLYQICQFIVCRDIGESQIAAAFANECPAARGPETDWSADLLFRHLPALIRLAQQLSNGDPLVQELNKIAATWPLSSVGVPELADLNLDTFIAQPAVARLYADRIVAVGDTSRLGDSRVDDLLRADIGIHRDLAPEIAKRLFEKEAGRIVAGD